MRIKVLALLVIFSIPISAIIGAVSIYLLNEIVQTANKTTYSLDEEISLLDQAIEKANRNEIESSDLVRIFKSQKVQRTAAYDLMNSIQKITYTAIILLFLIVFLQLSLLSSYMKKNNEK